MSEDDWKQYGNCRELSDALADPENEERVKRSIWWYLFEGYETDPSIPPITDAMCYTCPMIKQCFDFGTENGETGVYGGVYLLRGNIDESKNSHKTEEDWNKLQELLNGKDAG